MPLAEFMFLRSLPWKHNRLLIWRSKINKGVSSTVENCTSFLETSNNCNNSKIDKSNSKSNNCDNKSGNNSNENRKIANAGAQKQKLNKANTELDSTFALKEDQREN